MTPMRILSSMWLVPWPNDNHGKFTGPALQEQSHMDWFASTCFLTMLTMFIVFD